MSISPSLIANAADRVGIDAADLAAIIASGASRSYRAGDRLFSESSPREWVGIIQSGEVEIRRGTQSRSTLLAVLSGNALLGESLLLDDGAHSTTAVAKEEDPGLSERSSRSPCRGEVRANCRRSAKPKKSAFPG
jgi:aspartate ammonia-lyase